jgi:TatD DNase family protein
MRSRNDWACRDTARRCGIKPTHASFHHVRTRPHVVKSDKYVPGDHAMVKDRNEPCAVLQVVEAIAGIKGIGIQEVADQVYVNAFSALRLKVPQ